MEADEPITDFVFLRFDAYPQVSDERLREEIQKVLPAAVFHEGYLQSESTHALYAAVPPEQFARAFDVTLAYNADSRQWENHEHLVLPKSLDTLLLRMAFDAPKPVIPLR